MDKDVPYMDKDVPYMDKDVPYMDSQYSWDNLVDPYHCIHFFL